MNFFLFRINSTLQLCLLLLLVTVTITNNNNNNTRTNLDLSVKANHAWEGVRIQCALILPPPGPDPSSFSPLCPGYLPLAMCTGIVVFVPAVKEVMLVECIFCHFNPLLGLGCKLRRFLSKNLFDIPPKKGNCKNK